MAESDLIRVLARLPNATLFSSIVPYHKLYDYDTTTTIATTTWSEAFCDRRNELEMVLFFLCAEH